MERQLPKNVRQIGNVSDSSKIYVEDYVDTFFNQLCDKAQQEMIGAFLIGETVQEEEQDYIYIYGAVRMKELVMKGKDIVIDESTWKHACETCKEYFGNAEILGWFIAGGEQNLEVNHNINKMHQKYFSREKSIFVTKNTRDKEEKFYIYKYRNMMECSGHYIYYERNLEMQNYMIASRRKTGLTPSEIIEDRVTKNFRSLVREKAEKNERRTTSRMIYATSTFLIIMIVGIGVTMINNYEKMQKVQNSLNELSQNTFSQDEKDDEEKMKEQSAGNEQENPKEEIQQGDVEGEGDETVEAVGGDVTAEIGQVTDETPNSNTQAPQPEVYIVEKGDTLETISKEKYGDITHIDAICELNGLQDGNLIFIGQKLLLP